MRATSYKGRCTKKRLNKSESVVKLYDELQLAYASILEADEEIKEISAFVWESFHVFIVESLDAVIKRSESSLHIDVMAFLWMSSFLKRISHFLLR